MINLDQEKIVDAIINSGASPAGAEAASPLVDAYIADKIDRDTGLKVLAVECGFVLKLDPKLVIIGVQDAIFQDANGEIIGDELKTAKEPKRNKDGSFSAWWNEDVWLSEIVSGPQLAIYALALRHATYWDAHGTQYKFEAKNPKIRVSAAVKSSPPMFWPSEGEGCFEFPDAGMKSTSDALKARAAQIRALRASGLVPWQMTGKHCQNRYNKQLCRFYDEFCSKREHPPLTIRPAAFNANDPASQLALPHIDKELADDPEFVVMSASSYSDFTDCAEQWRLMNMCSGEKESNLALDTGTAYHAGIAELRRQVKALQKVG